jgi:hypothetical protein
MGGEFIGHLISVRSPRGEEVSSAVLDLSHTLDRPA